LFYPKKFLPKLNKNEFYQFEIIGKKAFNNEKCIGVISGFMGQNSCELIVIDRKESCSCNKSELLIPFVDEFIEKFDRENDIFYFKNIDELL
jgi:ribosomal 30S subunit maturation factor RimM